MDQAYLVADNVYLQLRYRRYAISIIVTFKGSYLILDDRKIKVFFKQALIEVIEEKKEVVHDLLIEVMKDIAMVRAIQDGENFGQGIRDDIFQILKGKEGFV